MNETIERLTLRGGQGGAIHEETYRLHRERYAFAAQYAKGRRVLDIACGVGYGSEMLHEAGASEVVGVDLSAEAITEANETFARPGIRFLQSDYRDLDPAKVAGGPNAELFSKPFDLIVSLETIEHIPDPGDFLRVTLSHLVLGGIHVGSVPVTPSMDANPFHLSDFSPSSFRSLLSSHGLGYLQHHSQVQSFNPFTVKKEMREGQRHGLRGNLMGYYAQHPGKLLLRCWATARYGFNNIYHTIASQKGK